MVKKRMKKVGSVFCLAIMLCLQFVHIANASVIESYDPIGHKFVQGIENVSCANNIDVDLYPELYAATAAAIRDWDWHLGLLNEQYGVNWNLIDITVDEQMQALPMIEFVTMGNDEAVQYAGHDVVSWGWIAFTEYLDENGYRINPEEEDWFTTRIIFMVEMLESAGYMHDYDALKQTANHEIGHALGLDEYTGDFGVIMYPYKQFCTATVPTAADLTGVYSIYCVSG